MAIKNLIQFLRESRAELAKVEWPKTQEFVGSTIVVLFLVSLFAVYLGAVDFGLNKLITFVLH
jgi:preprotein translocase subunit SecE